MIQVFVTVALGSFQRNSFDYPISARVFTVKEPLILEVFTATNKMVYASLGGVTTI